MNISEFTELRFGMFIHFGLYSQLERGEWVMNREAIPVHEYEKEATRFNPSRFNAEAVCRLAEDAGMKYIVFTTMHHEGFRMYRSGLSSYNSYQACRRDLTREIVDAAKKHGLKIGLYHSLNNWHDAPDAVDALEQPQKYQKLFIEHTFARLKELIELFTPVDILWYDGWWPFNADGWQAEKMNAMLRKIQPDLLFNGRNCLPGDFGTPEQHLTAPSPWRPWEACITLNDHFGYHRGDHNYKTPLDIIKMLLQCGAGNGNLLLNIGPRGDGSIPEEYPAVLHQVGEWLRQGGREAISHCIPMPLNPLIQQPGPYCGDWEAHGKYTASGNHLYLTLLYPPEKQLTIAGFTGKVIRLSVKELGELPFKQDSTGRISAELPEILFRRLAPVLDFEFENAPGIYRTGGLRIPRVDHTRYDPVRPDIQYS